MPSTKTIFLPPGQRFSILNAVLLRIEYVQILKDFKSFGISLTVSVAMNFMLNELERSLSHKKMSGGKSLAINDG